MNNTSLITEKSFVEQFGIAFEQTRLPRMAGRILGWLLISDPPHQSADELATGLAASRGSISSTTRLLIQLGLVERLSLPGIRHDYFRLRPDAWQNIIRHGLEDEIKMFRQLAEHGLILFSGKNPQTRKWLEDMRDVYAFLEQEFPALMERRKRVQEKRNPQVAQKKV